MPLAKVNFCVFWSKSNVEDTRITPLDYTTPDKTRRHFRLEKIKTPAGWEKGREQKQTGGVRLLWRLADTTYLTLFTSG